MDQFTDDNTEGYTPDQLDELNDRYEAAAIDATDDDERKGVAERVLRDYDSGIMTSIPAYHRLDDGTLTRITILMGDKLCDPYGYTLTDTGKSCDLLGWIDGVSTALVMANDGGREILVPVK